MANIDYKYFAFISYRGADVEIAKKLQKKFSDFKLPSTYKNPFDSNNKRMQPVCRDRDNFVGGKVSDQIKDAIDHSMFVVMICTPNMTKTYDIENYVNDEVEHLIYTNRINRLIPLVYDGRAYSAKSYIRNNRSIEDPFENESLPYALRKWMYAHTDHEYTLNIFNIEEQGERDEDKMFLRCVATILAQEFNTLWDRFKIEQKKRKQRVISAIILSVLVFFITVSSAIAFTQPVDISVGLNEISIKNDSLPPLKNAIISLNIDDYFNCDTIRTIDDYAKLKIVPFNYLHKIVRIKVQCENWIPIDTLVMLNKSLKLNISRDPEVYGNIVFKICDNIEYRGIPNIKVSVEGIEGITDSEGLIRLKIPLEKQKTKYPVNCEIPLRNNILDSYRTTTSNALIIK